MSEVTERIKEYIESIEKIRYLTISLNQDYKDTRNRAFNALNINTTDVLTKAIDQLYNFLKKCDEELSNRYSDIDIMIKKINDTIKQEKDAKIIVE